MSIQKLPLVAASLLLFACAGSGHVDGKDDGAANDALDSATGTVALDQLNVRSAPGLSADIKTTLPYGTTVAIQCQAASDAVDGDEAWDYLPEYGGYVADSYPDHRLRQLHPRPPALW